MATVNNEENVTPINNTNRGTPSVLGYINVFCRDQKGTLRQIEGIKLFSNSKNQASMFRKLMSEDDANKYLNERNWEFTFVPNSNEDVEF